MGTYIRQNLLYSKKFNVMNKRFILLSLFLIPTFLYAQLLYQRSPKDYMNSGNANFYSIRDSLTNYFVNNPDNEESGSYAAFLKWEWFWKKRVDSAGSFRRSA